MFLNYKKNRDWAENIQIVTQVGLTMAGCIVACFWAGRYLDRLLGTGGIMVVLFILFGIIGGGVVVYRQIMEVTEQKPGEGKHKDGDR